jgi:hypothetical protein
MITFAEVQIGSGDVCPCVRCGAPSGSPRTVADVHADYDAVREGWVYGPGPNALLTGFEPFAHPELPAVISGGAARGFERMRLRTDAGALSQGGNAAGLLSAGVRQLEVVLLGGQEAHDLLSGRPGLFDAARSGVSTFVGQAGLARERVVVTGFVSLCRHSIEDAAQAVAALGSMGAVAVQLDAVSLPDTESNSRLLDAVLETATINRVAAFVTGWRRPVGSLREAPPWRIIGAAQ